MNILI